MCGNNITEGDEQCDGEPCCNDTCQFLAEDYECNPSSGECDVPDTCSGLSPFCLRILTIIIILLLIKLNSL